MVMFIIYQISALARDSHSLSLQTRQYILTLSAHVKRCIQSFDEMVDDARIAVRLIMLNSSLILKNFENAIDVPFPFMSH